MEDLGIARYGDGGLSQGPSFKWDLEGGQIGDDWMMNDGEEEQDTAIANESFSESSSSVPLKSGAVAKKRRIRNRKLPITRIIKTDIRRHYSTMLTNVRNSHDINLVQSFFATYCTGQIHVESTMNKMFLGERPYERAEHLLSNVKGLLLFAALGIQLSPDESVAIKNTKVITRSDSDETMILIDWATSFTNLFDVDPNELVDEMVATACDLNSQLQPYTPPSLQLTIGETNDASALQDDFLRTSLGDMVSVVAAFQIPSSHRTIEVEESIPRDCSPNIDESRGSPHDAVAKIFTPAKPGTPMRIPDAFAYYRATRGHNLPLHSSPQRLEKHNRLVLTVNAQRQIVRITVLPLPNSDNESDPLATRYGPYFI